MVINFLSFFLNKRSLHCHISSITLELLAKVKTAFLSCLTSPLVVTQIQLTKVKNFFLTVYVKCNHELSRVQLSCFTENRWKTQ